MCYIIDIRETGIHTNASIKASNRVVPTVTNTVRFTPSDSEKDEDGGEGRESLAGDAFLSVILSIIQARKT